MPIVKFEKYKAMYKKSIILGLALTFAGIGSFGWGLFDQKKSNQLFQEQKSILNYELKNLPGNKVESNSFNAFEKKREKQLVKLSSIFSI